MGITIVPGSFVAHAGGVLPFKIECDTLDDEELKALADHAVTHLLGPCGYGRVFGILRGGLRMAARMEKYSQVGSPFSLIVDDVFTTGKSMNEERDRLLNGGHRSELVIGLVIVARAPTPSWIKPIFNLN